MGSVCYVFTQFCSQQPFIQEISINPWGLWNNLWRRSGEQGEAGFTELAFWWGGSHGTNDNIVNCACTAVMGTGNRRASSQARETGEPQGKWKAKGELGIILAKKKGKRTTHTKNTESWSKHSQPHVNSPRAWDSLVYSTPVRRGLQGGRGPAFLSRTLGSVLSARGH